MKDITYKDIFFGTLIVLGVFMFFTHGYLYNNAETQAKSIKLCQSVGADWRYDNDNQVFCVKPKKECVNKYGY